MEGNYMKMNSNFKKIEKEAKDIANKVTIRLDRQEMPDLPDPKPPKEKPAPEPPKKNQLIEIPYKVDISYNGKIREEDLDVDDPVHILLEKFRIGEIDAADLSVDDKFVMIRYMREEEGLTQDLIAEELGVTRRTVVNYCQKIKRLKAQELADSDIWEIGGELYAQGVKAMEDSIKKGKYKDFAYVMTSLIATLQSMGLVFKMPRQSQVQQNIITEHQAKMGAEGFKQLKNMGDKEEINLDNVLNELLAAVKTGKLDKKIDNDD